MFTRARSMSLMALAMSLFIASMLVPSTSEGAYRKRVLPSACAGATVEPFWEGKTYQFTSSNPTQDLFITAMAALDPYTGGEYAVAQAKWNSLCDPQRKAYKVWLESVVRVGLYMTYDYVLGFDGSSLFGGMSYPDGDGKTETKSPMDIEEIGIIFQENPRIFDIIAVGRPGTPHGSGTLDSFTSSVCGMTGTNCPKKAAAPKATATSGSASSSGGSTGSAPATPPADDTRAP